MKLHMGVNVTRITSSEWTSHNGLFKKHVLYGAMGAKGFNCIDSPSRFVDVIVENFCGDGDDASVPEVFIMYTNIVRKLCQKNGENGWSDDVVKKTTKCITYSKKKVWRCLQSLQQLKWVI